MNDMASQIDPEFEMFTFFEMTPDLVCIAGKDGFFRKVNQSVINKLEYTEEELFASPIATFIHPEDKNLTSLKRAELLNGKALINFQNRYVTKKGKTIWLHWTSIYLPDKEVVFAIAKDITERKQIELEIEKKYIKFKSLASHFKTRIEKDRKYFAVELHEELAQLASTVKMDLDWITSNTPDLTTSSKERIDHAAEVSQLLINAIRRISYSVSPNMLDDLGLTETLKWLCEEFAIINNIPCQFEATGHTDSLPYEIQLDIFRICQESLTTIMHQAQASTVNVTIESVGNKIRLTITDDGSGIEMDHQKKSSGFTSIQERAASINGEITITHEMGKGTNLCFTIAQEFINGD